jgi:hypothetical protein
MANTPFWEKLTAGIAETCAVTGFGRSTICELIADGTLESRKVNGRRLIVVVSVLKLLGLDRQLAATVMAGAAPQVTRKRGRPRKAPAIQQQAA